MELNREALDKQTLRALSVPIRQDIVKLLSNRPYSASELSKKLGKHVTTIAEHLGILEQSGLAARKPDGHKWIYYVLTPRGEKMFKPHLYSWTIILSISIVCAVIGSGLIGARLFVFTQAADMLVSTPLAAIGESKGVGATIETQSQIAQLDIILFVGIILVAIAIAGILWAIMKRK